VKNDDYALDHMMACAVLHNFILRGGREAVRRDFHFRFNTLTSSLIYCCLAHQEGMAIEGLPPPMNLANAPAEVQREHPLLRQAQRQGTAKRDAIADVSRAPLTCIALLLHPEN